MEPNPPVRPDCGCANKTDRYVSFVGIDCDGNARKLMECIENKVSERTDLSSWTSFWSYFMAKRTPRSGPAPDDLFLIHCHINQVRDFFEECGDTQALALLTQLEEECC